MRVRRVARLRGDSVWRPSQRQRHVDGMLRFAAAHLRRARELAGTEAVRAADPARPFRRGLLRAAARVPASPPTRPRGTGTRVAVRGARHRVAGHAAGAFRGRRRNGRSGRLHITRSAAAGLRRGEGPAYVRGECARGRGKRQAGWSRARETGSIQDLQKLCLTRIFLSQTLQHIYPNSSAIISDGGVF